MTTGFTLYLMAKNLNAFHNHTDARTGQTNRNTPFVGKTHTDTPIQFQ